MMRRFQIRLGPGSLLVSGPVLVDGDAAAGPKKEVDVANLLAYVQVAAQ